MGAGAAGPETEAKGRIFGADVAAGVSGVAPLEVRLADVSSKSMFSGWPFQGFLRTISLSSMQLEGIKEQIKEISAIAAAVPEEFRQKCFELLMSHLLGGPAPTVGPIPPAAWGQNLPPVLARPGYSGAPPMTALLAAFVKKIGLSQDQFGRVVGYEHGNVVFYREPVTDKPAQSQIEWALLLALKNAIVKGAFSVDAEEVRLVCQEKGVFDRRNFYTVFRRYGDYFRNAPEPTGRPQPLSSKGLTALGALIKTLAESVTS